MDCDLGLPLDCQGTHGLGPWGGTLGPDSLRPHRGLGEAQEEERVLCCQPRAPLLPGCPPEKARATRVSFPSASQDIQESSTTATEAAGESR